MKFLINFWVSNGFIQSSFNHSFDSWIFQKLPYVRGSML